MSRSFEHIPIPTTLSMLQSWSLGYSPSQTVTVICSVSNLHCVMSWVYLQSPIHIVISSGADFNSFTFFIWSFLLLCKDRFFQNSHTQAFRVYIACKFMNLKQFQIC
jgi:hypothetical protein